MAKKQVRSWAKCETKKEKSGICVIQMPDQSVCFFRCFFMDKIRYLSLTGYVHFWMTFWRRGDTKLKKALQKQKKK